MHCQSMRTLKKHLLHLNIFHLITNVLRMTNEHLCYTFTPLFPFLPFTNKVCVTLAEMPQLEPISPQPATHTVCHQFGLHVCECECVCAHSAPSRPHHCQGFLATRSESSSCCFIGRVKSISNSVLSVKQLYCELASPFSVNTQTLSAR